MQKTTYTTVVVQRRIEEALLHASAEASTVDEPIEFIVMTKPSETEAENLTYYWSFYDDLKAEYVTYSSIITYSFQGEGSRHITVTVRNNVSEISAHTSVNVCGKISGLTFTGCCGRIFNTTIMLEAYVNTGQVSNYQWLLRNDHGTTLTVSTGHVFVYTFASAGRYQIQLTAENQLSNQTIIDYFRVQVSIIHNNTLLWMIKLPVC